VSNLSLPSLKLKIGAFENSRSSLGVCLRPSLAPELDTSLAPEFYPTTPYRFVLGEGKQYLLTKGTLVQIVIGTTLAQFLEEKEFGDGRPWRTVHKPRLAIKYSIQRSGLTIFTIYAILKSRFARSFQYKNH
jgi:hypothetical protein